MSNDIRPGTSETAVQSKTTAESSIKTIPDWVFSLVDTLSGGLRRGEFACISSGNPSSNEGK